MSRFGSRAGLLVAIAAVAVTALVISACGSSSSSSSSAAAGGGSSSGSGKTYVLATSADFPPFSSRSANDPNTIVGFEPDMMAAVMKHLGLKYKWVTSDFNGLIPSVQSGRVDMVVSDVFDTSARRKVVDFIDYLTTSLSIMTTSDNASKVHSFTDLCGKTMGILTGASTELAFAQTHSNDCKKAGKPAIQIHSYPAVAQEVAALQNGNLYAMFEDTITEALIQKSKHGALKELFSDPEAATKLGIAVKKGGSVESKIRSGVQWYLSSPQYKANATKWGFPTSSLITSTGG